jgi:hypothetical protein
MSEVGTVTFSFKVANPRGEDYEQSLFSQTVPYLVEDSDQATLNNARSAFFTAQTLVYEQAGVEFELDENDNPRPVVARHGSRSAEANVAPNRPSGGVTILQRWAEQDVPQWAYDQAREKGVTRMYDNRKDHADFGGTGNGPYFRAADGTLDNSGRPMGIWKPRD